MSADISQFQNDGTNHLQWWNDLSGPEQQKWLTTFITHAKFSNVKPKSRKDRYTLLSENESIPKRRPPTPNVEDYDYFDNDFDFDSKSSTPVMNNFMDRVKPSPFAERKSFSRI